MAKIYTYIHYPLKSDPESYIQSLGASSVFQKKNLDLEGKLVLSQAIYTIFAPLVSQILQKYDP